MIEVDIDALMQGRIVQVSKYGLSRQAQWQCEDKWIVGYSTSSIEKSSGGKYDGKFACAVWKPNNKKNPSQWKMVYFRAFSKRKLARAYAEKFYYKHSPRKAKAHGRS